MKRKYATQSPPMNVSDLMVEIDQSNLRSMVLEAPIPVILDCYADWCQPCKQLTPLLESVVRSSGGRVRLAKLNVDTQPELSQQLQVRSLPTVFGLVNGKVVDSFMGMVSETQLKTFLKKLLEAGGVDGEDEEEPDALAHANTLLEAGDIAGAAAVFKAEYAELTKGASPSKDKGVLRKQVLCLVGLARCALASEEIEDVKELLKLIKTKYSVEIASESDVASAVASLELSTSDAMLNEGAGGMAEMEMILVEDPNDHSTRYKLAQHLFQQGLCEEAIDHALEIVKRDISWDDAAGRQLLLKFFDSLGPDNEIAQRGRRRLTNFMFI